MTEPIPYRLTPQQWKISDLVTKGWTSKEIGREVGLSRRTVEDHRAAIFKKVGVRNAIELTRKLLTGASQ